MHKILLPTIHIRCASNSLPPLANSRTSPCVRACGRRLQSHATRPIRYGLFGCSKPSRSVQSSGAPFDVAGGQKRPQLREQGECGPLSCYACRGRRRSAFVSARGAALAAGADKAGAHAAVTAAAGAAGAAGQDAQPLGAAAPSWAAAAPPEEATTATPTGEERGFPEEGEVADCALACEADEAAPAAAGYDGGMAAPPPVPGQGGREPPPAGGEKR